MPTTVVRIFQGDHLWRSSDWPHLIERNPSGSQRRFSLPHVVMLDFTWPLKAPKTLFNCSIILILKSVFATWQYGIYWEQSYWNLKEACLKLNPSKFDRKDCIPLESDLGISLNELNGLFLNKHVCNCTHLLNKPASNCSDRERDLTTFFKKKKPEAKIASSVIFIIRRGYTGSSHYPRMWEEEKESWVWFSLWISGQTERQRIP